MVSLREQREHWLKELERAGAFAPAFELCELIRFVTGWEEAAQRARAQLPEGAVPRVDALVRRRCAGEPLQYILGEWEFYGLPFYVGEGVLIPRADTEALVEQALRLVEQDGATGKAPPRIADLCSGTGCVAIALAKRLPQAEVFAVERSTAAYTYLVRNVARNKAVNVTPILGDALAEDLAFPPALPRGFEENGPALPTANSPACQRVLPVEDSAPTSPRGFEENGPALPTANSPAFQRVLPALDMIVSNPPYIPTGELASLAPEVRREPALALDGREDGLYFYRELVRVCLGRLRPGGWLLFECGDTQAPAVLKLLHGAGYTQLATKKDLEGFDRVVLGRRPCE